MWGISYGGFTAIQVALLRPPHLAAIVPMMATDDRYTDDVHYLGGCMTVSELSQYAVSMVAMNALPALPAYRGAAWIDEWRERLERTPVWLFEWLRQQRDGPYWRQGSLAPHWDRLTTPMLLIGGWMDEYVDAALRMLERCTNAPRRALIGNWVHSYPDDAYPGPNLDWHHEMVRFLDHWLKGIDNGVMDEPALVAFRHEWAPPEPFPEAWPGDWVAEPAWPPADRTETVFRLASGEQPLLGRLVAAGGGRRRATAGPRDADGPAPRSRRSAIGRPSARGRASRGARATPPNGLARDLRPTTPACRRSRPTRSTADLDVLGAAAVELTWESPVPVATAVVRLQDVAPDGTPFQVASGILNLTHRDSHETPAALEPGAPTDVRVVLRSTAHRFRAGHRIRLSVASAMWPVVWPSPEPAEHRLHLGGARPARLVLPTVPTGRPGDPGAAVQDDAGRLPRDRRRALGSRGLADRRGRDGGDRDRPDRPSTPIPSCPTVGCSGPGSGSR